ncbi:penicillin-binding protein activator LpoB [Candidatus Poribacteria bacterium]|nr:penicillin-binding protein activator LpoB [Candidatus Poribacteria bacterium]
MRNVRVLFVGLLLVLLTLVFSSCATSPRVTRTSADEQIDLSGNWNDTDSGLVSKEMIADSLTRPWLDEFTSKNNTKPRVLVGTVSNKSHEHINTETFTKDLEKELTNSGKVRFVASREQRDEIRDERVEQAKNASTKTAKSSGQEYGADFMIKGQINTIMDEADKMQLKYYQVELEMIDIATNEKVWIGQKKIKKTVERSRSKF